MAKDKNKKGFITEFKEFVMRGNVIDLAVGVIVGGAFSTITNSLVNDVLMPIVSMFLGGINFEQWKITLPNLFGQTLEEPNTLNFGTFLATVINFLILALVIFIIVRQVNKLRTKAEELHKAKEAPAEEAPAEEPKPTSEELLADILAELRKDK
jgi:large conductance mechanosensitive channel